MRTFEVKDIQCIYRMNDGVLEFKGINDSDDEYSPVDEELIGDEKVSFMMQEMTYSEMYRLIEKALQA